MKYLMAVLTVISMPCRAAAVCGLYQVEDFGDRVLYTITRFATAQMPAANQTTFTIINPANPTVRLLVRGMCYCVSGTVQSDPEFEGDESYQLLTLLRIEGAPYSGCIPVAENGTAVGSASLN